MEVIQMTPREAIEAMESAIKNGDKKKILELKDKEILPEWEYETNYVWEKWEQLTEKAEQILGL